MKRIALAGIAALAAFAVQAEPIRLASLANIDGKILVNKGKGFVSAKPGMALTDGDRVIALDGSRAAVVYPDGCVTQIKENSLLAMEKGAGCNKELVRTGANQPLRYAQAIGGSAIDAKDTKPGSPVSAPVTQTGLGGAQTFILIGGALGVGGMLFDASQDDDPISAQ